MKIVKLRSENIMRLMAVEITPQGNLVTIGGKNGAGKSSVLNSIAMALGGAALAPTEPIRAGENNGKIELDLGAFTVTRKFWREEIVADDVTTYGETKSSISISSKDGAVYRSPQAMLDKLFGALTFDPLAFKTEDKAKQRETLRKLVGLDVTAFDRARQEAYDDRARLKKQHAAKAAQLAAMPSHSGLPDAEVSLDVIASEMRAAEDYRRLAENAERDAEKIRDKMAQNLSALSGRMGRAQELQTQLDAIRREIKQLEGLQEDERKNLDAAGITAQAARAVVPDVASLQAKLSKVEADNAKIRQNAAHRAAGAEVSSLERSVKLRDRDVKAAEDDKRKALAAVVYPVKGLGLDDDGVTYGGLPFAQASSSEQLRVSVAIGLAMNPALKVLLVRNGNLLDDDSLAALAEQAEKADAQVWMEYVTGNDEGVSVFIEDGAVRTK